MQPAPDAQPTTPDARGSAPAFLPGARLGPYRVVRELGRGGMGVVLLGHDDGLDRPAALKVMIVRAGDPAADRERFLREARSAARVRHDHVVTIYGVGEERGTPYIAMEYLQGSALDGVLRQRGKLSPAWAARVGREMALGLAAAHGLGMIHRDIKPANVWLEAPRGRVKLLDFGLARRAADDAQITADGAILGTPAFMSPEQARAAAVDHRTDLFGLGAVLYLAVTGRQPFEGGSALAVLAALAVDDPPPVRSLAPDAPPELADLIHKLLSKSADQRPQSAAEVAARLLAVERALHAPSVPSPEVTATIAPPAPEEPEPAAPAGPDFEAADAPTVTRVVQPPTARRNWLAGGLLAGVAAAACALAVGVSTVFTVPDADTTAATAPATPSSDSTAQATGPTAAPMTRLPGGPLTPSSWVTRPAALPGVRAWTVVPRAVPFVPTAAAYSPDGKWLALASVSGDVRLLDPPSLETRRVLAGDGNPLTSLSWSGDSETLAAGTSPAGVVLWDVSAPRLLKALPFAGFERVADVSLSGDGRTLGVSLTRTDEAGAVLALDTADGRELFRRPTAATQLRSRLRVSPDGQLLAHNAAWGVSVHRVADGATVLKPPFSRSTVQSLAWSPDSRKVIAGWADGSVTFSDAQTGAVLKSLPKAHPAECRGVAWDLAGRRAASVDAQKRLTVWDAADPKELGSHEVPEAARGVCWSPDGALCAWADAWCQVWPDALGRGQRQPHGPAGGRPVGVSAAGELLTVEALWSADGSRYAVSSERLAEVEVWDRDSGKKVCGVPRGADLIALAWSPRGQTLAVARGGANPSVALHRADTGAALATVPTRVPVGPAFAVTDGPAVRVLFQETINGKTRLLCREVGAAAAAWSVELSGPARAVVPSPDGEAVACVAKDECDIFEAATGAARHTLRTRGRCLNAVWAPDGRHLMTTDGAGRATAWELPPETGGPATGRPVRSLGAGGCAMSAAWLAPVKGWLLSFDDGSVAPFDPERGRCGGVALIDKDAVTLVGPEGHVRTPDGTPNNFLYVAELLDGTQVTLAPGEFADRFGWRNDPAGARLLPGS